MKPEQEIIFLSMWTPQGPRVDVNGRFICQVVAGPNVGRTRIRIGAVNMDVAPERVMDAVEYHALIRAGVVPQGASGVRHYLEGGM